MSTMAAALRTPSAGWPNAMSAINHAKALLADNKETR
jgi:hypothetical protein